MARFGASVLLAAALAAALAGPAVAQDPITKVTQSFGFDGAAAVSAEPQTVRKGKPLLTALVRPTDVVAIDTPVEVTVTNGIKVRSKRQIAPGDVLQGWPGKPGVYCAPARESPLYITAACLQDADGDGRFEASLTAEFTDQRVETYNVGHKGGIVAVVHGEPTPLAALIAYRKADPAAGPGARVKVMWTVVGTPGPSDPVTLSFYLLVDDLTRASFAVGEGGRFTLPGRSGDIDLHGLKIHVLGIDPDGSIRFTTEGGGIGGPVDIIFGHRRPPVVIYVPV